MAAGLTRALGPLAPTAEDRRQARGALLGLLAREASSWVAAGLAGALGALDPTAEDRRQARGALLGLLARETNSGLAAGLAGALGPLDPTAEDRRQASDALLGLLAREASSWAGRRAGGRAGRARDDGGRQAPGPRRAARAASPRDQQPPGPRAAARATAPRDQLGGRRAGGRAGRARDDGGRQAPGPRRAARAASPRDQQRAGRRAGGRAGRARPDGGRQAAGPRRAARAAGPRDRQQAGRGSGRQAGPARPDSPRPQNMARLGGPTTLRTACWGAPELGTYQLACNPPLAGLALRFTRLRHRTRQPQSRPRTPETAATGKVARHASDKLQRKVAETTTCDHALAVLAETGRTAASAARPAVTTGSGRRTAPAGRALQRNNVPTRKGGPGDNPLSPERHRHRRRGPSHVDMPRPAPVGTRSEHRRLHIGIRRIRAFTSPAPGFRRPVAHPLKLWRPTGYIGPV